MIILLSTVPAIVKGLWGFISADGGSNPQPNRIARLIETQPIMNQASLICTCDSGKVSKLYYLNP
jgi:hypothetical protein